MTKQYFIYARTLGEEYGSLYSNIDGGAVSTNCDDMATTFAIHLSNKFNDVFYVVLRYIDGLPSGSLGEAINGYWENHHEEDDVLIPMSVARAGGRS